jgi:hypothetical protein
VTGNVSVIAAGDDMPALDALISSSGSPQDCIDDACSAQANATPTIDFSGGPLNLSLGLGQSVIGVAGTVAISVNAASSTNIGLSLAVNSVDVSHRAAISGIGVTAGGLVNVAATDEAQIIAFAIGAGGSSGGGTNAMGSVALNFIDNSSIAIVGDPAATSQTTSINSAALTIAATNTSTIKALTGSILVWQQKAFGISVSYNEIGNNTTAETLWSTLTQTGAVQVSANSTETIQSLAATLAFSSGWFFAGAATVNIINDSVNALIGDPNASGESERIIAG